MNPAYGLSPLFPILVLGFLMALTPVLWVVLRRCYGSLTVKLQTLTVVTFSLAFVLVLLGCFTRLTDSGLACPDWPGCYGRVTPLAAHAEIAAAQAAMPTGPVTYHKAWIDMAHRYLALCVGVFVFFLFLAHWVASVRLPRHSIPSPWCAVVTMFGVLLQAVLGASMVHMQLFPAIVSLHLFGAYGLLLLGIQVVWWAQAQGNYLPVPVSPGLRRGLIAVFALLLFQAFSGAWVSSNYAVLACTDFPKCQGSWWPWMNFAEGFEIWRPLGLTGAGGYVSFQALTAIHYVHRLLGVFTLLALVVLLWHLWRKPELRRPTRVLILLLALQVLSGWTTAMLGWPLPIAMLHTAGAGALLLALLYLLVTTSKVYNTTKAMSPAVGATSGVAKALR